MSEIKTYKGWTESKEGLGQYLNIGDTVDSEIFEHMLGCVPPAFFGGGCLMMGEAYSYDSEGDQTYMTLWRHGKEWIYAGHMSFKKREAMAKQLFIATIVNS